MAGFIEMPKPKKRATSSIDQLSDPGRELVEELLADGKTYNQVIAALAEKTGEKISRSSLSRFRVTDFEPTRQRIAAARDAASEIADMLRDGRSVEDKFTATAQGLFDIMLTRVMEMKGADVAKLSREARMFQQARTAQRRADNDEQRLKLDQEKLDLDRRELDKKLADFEAKQAAARDAAQELVGGKELSDEQLQKIRDLYGLHA